MPTDGLYDKENHQCLICARNRKKMCKFFQKELALNFDELLNKDMKND